MKVIRKQVRHRSTARRLSRPQRTSDRRLALLKRSGLFGEYTHGAKISRACTLGDLREAYHLVYESFLEAGYIEPNPYRLRIRTFEATAETATFIAKTDTRVVAATSLVIDSPDLGLPTDSAFGPELDALRRQGLKLSETSNQAIDPILRKTAVTTNLMRCCLGQAMLTDRDLVVIAVSPSHKSFYELLGFERISDVRSYSDKMHDPVIMMRLDVHPFRHRQVAASPTRTFIRDFLSFKNPFHHRLPQWRHSALKCFEDTELLRTLCVRESNLLATCTDAQRLALRRRWGDELFQAVVSENLTAAKPATKINTSGMSATGPGSRIYARNPGPYRFRSNRRVRT